MFTQPAEPTEQMRVAAQFGDLAKLWEVRAEIRQKSACHVSIVVDRAGPKSEGERPNLRFENLFQAGLARESWEVGRVQPLSLLDGAGVFAPDVLRSKFDVEHGGRDLRMAHQLL